MIVAASMICKVSRPDEVSQTIRLAFGSEDEGSRNGKREMPAVAMMLATAKAEVMKVRPGNLAARIIRIERMAPRKGEGWDDEDDGGGVVVGEQAAGDAGDVFKQHVGGAAGAGEAGDYVAV